QQMEETRSALTEKLQTLENQVVETVSEANTAVVQTVETVKEAVHDTVETVKGTVEDTVESVKSAFDISQHVDRHPWLMMGGAVALGYLGGCVLERERSAHRRQEWRREPFVPPASRTAESGSRGNGSSAYEGKFRTESTRSSWSGWLSSLTETIAPEIDKLK